MAGGDTELVNLLLEKLAGVAARRHWIFIVAWVVVLGGRWRQSRVRRRVRQQLHDLRQRLRDRPQRAEQHLPAAGRLRRADRVPRHERHGRRAAVGGQPVGHQRVQAAGRHQGGQPVRLVQRRHGVQGRHDRLRQRLLEREPGLARHQPTWTSSTTRSRPRPRRACRSSTAPAPARSGSRPRT